MTRPMTHDWKKVLNFDERFGTGIVIGMIIPMMGVMIGRIIPN